MRLQVLSTRLLALTLAGSVSTLAACSKSEPQVFVSLHVTPVGEYSVSGKAVAGSQLAAELAKLKPQHGRFAIGFQAAASAPQASVQHAMSTAKQLGATVSFVGNEKF